MCTSFRDGREPTDLWATEGSGTVVHKVYNSSRFSRTGLGFSGQFNRTYRQPLRTLLPSSHFDFEVTVGPFSARIADRQFRWSLYNRRLRIKLDLRSVPCRSRKVKKFISFFSGLALSRPDSRQFALQLFHYSFSKSTKAICPFSKSAGSYALSPVVVPARALTSFLRSPMLTSRYFRTVSARLPSLPS